MTFSRINCLLLTCLIATSATGQTGSSGVNKRLPGDNVAWFAPGDATLKVQLTTLDGQDSLAASTVTLIDPAGKTRQFETDENGTATLTEINEGVHGIVANQGSLHGALVVAIRSLQSPEDETTDIFGLDFAAADQVRPLTVSMMTLDNEDLRTVVKNNLSSSSTSPANSMNNDLVVDQPVDDSFQFKIQLGEDGSLRGKLISLMDPRSRQSGLQGTSVVIFKHGKPVGKTLANAFGQFRIVGVKPGVHGLMVAGRGGYTAFAFEATNEEGLLSRNSNGRMFAISQLSNDGETMPVALIPPSMHAQIIDSVMAASESESQDTSSQQIAIQNEQSKPGENLSNKDAAELVARTELAEQTPQVIRSAPTAKPEPSKAQASKALAKRIVRSPLNPLRADLKTRKAPFNPLRSVVAQ